MLTVTHPTPNPTPLPRRIAPTGRAFRALLAGLLLACGTATAQLANDTVDTVEFQPTPASAAHIEALRAGGYVIYMRHGATDARIPDMIPVELDNCASQRPLTDAGRAQLDEIGENFAKLGIPHLPAISSPFCRAEESARRVFGVPVEIDPDLRYTAAMPDAEKAPAVARTRHWISLPLDKADTNRVVVAHGPNVAEVMDYLPREATLIIFRPLGLTADPSFEYIASIEPTHWPVLFDLLGLE